MVDACTAWAEQNHMVLAMSVLDWAGNQLESHAMEGAGANSIDTALLKAKSALRWRRPTSEMNKIVRSGENLAPTFMKDFPQPGALPIREKEGLVLADGPADCGAELVLLELRLRPARIPGRGRDHCSVPRPERTACRPRAAPTHEWPP